jgi:dihydrofolate synthase/folylpolyglutamate synthase
MFSRIGQAAYKKDLHNTLSLCAFLNNPHEKFKSIHVAGTNGKGSTSHMLAAVLQEAGYKTGLYTSPHLYDFGERIRINGQPVDQDFVVDFVQRTKDITEEIKPSFFELTVAMAFDYFATQQVDIAVIETGLGGRLDSTNVISPILSVITNISYDHINILGNTLEEIASEKAGIIKKNTPVVIGEIVPETHPVFIAKANELDAPIHITTERFIIEYIESYNSLLLCNIKNTATNIVEKLRLDLGGLYQSKNAATVLCCIEELRKELEIHETHIHSGLENVRKLTGLRGRWDIIRENPTVILDVSHNEDGIRNVLQQLAINYTHASIHFVIGFVKDKDVNLLLSLFPLNAKYYFTNAHIPRALKHDELKTMANSMGLKGGSFDDVNEAIQIAISNASANDVVIVCGSFFVVGEAERNVDVLSR